MIKSGSIILTFLILVLMLASCLPPQGAKNSTAQVVPTTNGDVELVTNVSTEGASNGSAGVSANGTVPTATGDEPPAQVSTTSAVVTNVKKSNQSITDATIKVKENDLLKLYVNYSDPDSDIVNLSFSKPLDKKGEWKTSYGDAGEYQSTIVATDGKLSTTTKLKIIVERVNVAPYIDGVEDLTVKEGEVVKFEPKVTDPNEDQVTVTISDPLKNGVFKTDHTSAGDYKIKIVATDGELKTEKNFLLRVLDVNVKPTMTLDGITEKLVVKEGDVVRFKPSVTDLDGDKVKVTISDPVGDDGIWETKFTDHGQYVITVIADDGKDKVTKKIDLTVQDQNAPPEIISVNLVK